jgi:hypothetical protein
MIRIIAALDLATTTGWARGTPDDAIPSSGVMRFGNAESSSDAIFGAALKWFSEFFKQEPRPTNLIMESLPPPTAMQGATSAATYARLAGLHGIARSAAHLRGIYDIGEISVLQVRQHFCGSRAAGKQGVFDKCKALGWPVNDLNESDACAVWHYACSMINPTRGFEVSPLFGKRRAAAR